MKKLMLFLFAMIFLIGFVSADTSITNCITINESGVYNIENNINTDSSPCIFVNASDVTINGNGYYIDDQDAGNRFGYCSCD